MLVRSNSESIAFHGTCWPEAVRAADHLDILIGTQRSIANRQFFLNFCINFTDYIGAMLSFVLLAISIFYSDIYANLTAAQLSGLISAVRLSVLQFLSFSRYSSCI